MSFPKFFEYCTNKKKELTKKPKIMKVGDRVTGSDDLDFEPNKPPKEARGMKDGKHTQVKESESKGLGNLWGDKAPDGPPASGVKGAGKPAPYRGPGKDQGQKSVDGNIGQGGFGNMGDTKYEPDTKCGDSKFFPGGKTPKTSSWESKTESFINKTKDMSLGKFAKYMLQKECSEYSTDTVNSITNMIKENSKTITPLVLEMKRKNLLGKAIKEMLQFPETYSTLAYLLTNERTANSLVRAMNEQYMSESVGPPIGFDDEEEMTGDEDANAEEEIGDEEDMEGEEGDDEDLDNGDEDLDDEDMEDDDMEDDDEYLNNDEEEASLDDEENPDGMEGDEMSGDEMSGEEMPPPRRRQQFAFDNLITAMGKFKQMRDAMGEK
jgi:hypothetical protein